MMHEDPKIVAQYPDEDVRGLFYDGHCEGWRIIKMAAWSDVEDAWDDGWNHPDAPGSDMAASYAADCERNSREFSPGEFLCKEINAYPDREAAWAAYEAGVRHGAEAAYWFYEVIGEGTGPKMAGGMMFFQQGGAA